MNYKSIFATTLFALTLGVSASQIPASAQNYGNGYGYNNGIKGGYGPAYGAPQRRDPGCSTLSMDSTCW